MNPHDYQMEKTKLSSQLPLLAKETKLRRLDLVESEIGSMEEFQARDAKVKSQERLDFFLVDYLSHKVHRGHNEPYVLNDSIKGHFENVSNLVDEHIGPGMDRTEQRREVLEKLLAYAERATVDKEDDNFYSGVREDLGEHFTNDSAQEAVRTFEDLQKKVREAIDQQDSLFVNKALDYVEDFQRAPERRARELERINSIMAEEPQAKGLKHFARLQEEREQRLAREAADDDSFVNDGSDKNGQSRKRARELLSDDTEASDGPSNGVLRRRLNEAGQYVSQYQDRHSPSPGSRNSSLGTGSSALDDGLTRAQRKIRANWPHSRQPNHQELAEMAGEAFPSHSSQHEVASRKSSTDSYPGDDSGGSPVSSRHKKEIQERSPAAPFPRHESPETGPSGGNSRKRRLSLDSDESAAGQAPVPRGTRLDKRSRSRSPEARD